MVPIGLNTLLVRAAAPHSHPQGDAVPPRRTAVWRLQVTLNIIAILLAWYFQAVISGFYSAIRGGETTPPSVGLSVGDSVHGGIPC
jgi:hypothetical protein